jgi:hypothetical protein
MTRKIDLVKKCYFTSKYSEFPPSSAHLYDLCTHFFSPCLDLFFQVDSDFSDLHLNQ